MRFSVALCTCNGGAYLREQLDSLAAQTRLPDELVVCDDASTDNTASIIEHFALEVPFPVRVFVNEVRLGVTRNFDRAFGLCQGDLIAPADQDDVWHPDKLRLIEEQFATDADVGLVFTDLEVVDERLQPLGHRAWQSDGVEFDRGPQRLLDRGKAVDVLLTRNVVTGCAMAFKSRFRSLVCPIPLEVCGLRIVHDYWIAALVAAASKVRYLDRPLVKYRRHGNQQVGLSGPRTEPDPNAWTRGCRRMVAYPVWADLSEAIGERLAGAGPPFADAGIISALTQRAQHARTRELVWNYHYPRRVLTVLGEVLRLHYHRFPHPDGDGYELARDLLPYRFLPRFF